MSLPPFNAGNNRPVIHDPTNLNIFDSKETKMKKRMEELEHKAETEHLTGKEEAELKEIKQELQKSSGVMEAAKSLSNQKSIFDRAKEHFQQ